MDKSIDVKAIFNKKNGQVNISLPKKKMSQKTINSLKLNPHLRIKLEGVKL